MLLFFNVKQKFFEIKLIEPAQKKAKYIIETPN